MAEAMEYLTASGIPCRSRSTFYRLLKDFGVAFNDLNPCGKYRMRRFFVDELDRIISSKAV